MAHIAFVTLLFTLLGTTVAAQGDSIVSATALAGIHLCEPLSGLTGRLPKLRDTTVESEGTQWPGKLLRLNGGAQILFEASWADKSHIWRITTNSVRFRTSRGARVGMTVGALRDTGVRLRLEEEEGVAVLTDVSEGVSFTLEAAPGTTNSLDELPSSTRLRQLIITADCR